MRITPHSTILAAVIMRRQDNLRWDEKNPPIT